MTADVAGWFVLCRSVTAERGGEDPVGSDVEREDRSVIWTSRPWS
ncbi:hypothetical protein [Streptomyces sp. NPDC097610]